MHHKKWESTRWRKKAERPTTKQRLTYNYYSSQRHWHFFIYRIRAKRDGSRWYRPRYFVVETPLYLHFSTVRLRKCGKQKCCLEQMTLAEIGFGTRSRYESPESPIGVFIGKLEPPKPSIDRNNRSSWWMSFRQIVGPQSWGERISLAYSGITSRSPSVNIIHIFLRL